MSRAMFAVAAMLVAALSLAQEAPGYAPAENPFQNDYDFALGRPIKLRVDVKGVRLDTITVVSVGEVRAGEKIKCEIDVTGSNETDKKAGVTAILLLESAEGKGIERVSLDPFKAKAGKPFAEKQKISIQGDSLRAASKVYVFVQIAF